MKLELTHDLLAEEIYKSMTLTAPELVQLRRKEEFVHTQFEFYNENGSLLSKSQLEDIEPFIQLMDINSGERDFINESYALVRQQERQRRRLISGIILLLIAGIVSTSWMAYRAAQSANAARRQAAISEASRLANLAIQESAKSNKTDALVLAKLAYEKTMDDPLPSVKRALTEAFHADLGVVPLLAAKVKHESEIRLGAIAPEADRFVTVDEEHNIKMWQMDGGLLKSFQAHDNYIHGLAFSFDGQYFATASSDGVAKIWTSEGQLHQECDHEGEEVIKLGFSPGGDVLITLDFQKNIHLFNLNGQLISTIKNKLDSKPLLAMAPDNASFMVIYQEEQLEWYDFSGNLLNSSLIKERFKGLAFSEDGQVAVYKEGNTNFRWNKDGTLERFKMPSEAELEAYYKNNDREGVQKLMDELQEQEIAIFSAVSNYPPQYILFRERAINSTKREVVIDGARLKLRNSSYLSLNNPDVLLHKHQDVINGVVFSNDNDYFLSWSKDHTANLWRFTSAPAQDVRLRKDDFSGRFEYNPIPDSLLSEHRLNKIIPNPNDRILYAYHDTLIKVWNKDWELINVLEKGYSFSKIGHPDFGISSDGQLLYLLEGFTLKVMDAIGQEVGSVFESIDLIDRAAFVPNSKALIICPRSGPIQYWNFANNEVLDTLQYNSAPSSVTVAEDGAFAIIGFVDGHLKKWNLKGSKVEDYHPHDKNIFAIAIAPNGQSFLSASGDHTAKLFVEGERDIRILEHNGAVLGATFSSDGAHILTFSEDKTVHFWDRNGALQYTLGKTGDNWDYGMFSPDATHFLTANESNGKVALWQLDGQEVGRYDHSKFLNSVTFSPTGRYLISAYDASNVRFGLTPESIFQWLEQNPLVPLSPEEENLYGIH